MGRLRLRGQYRDQAEQYARDIVLLQTTSVLDRFQAFLLDCRNTERTQCLA